MRGKKEGVVLGVEISRFLIWLYLQSKGGGLVRGGNCLLHCILKANKYFPVGSFLSAKSGSNPSWTWRSILEGRKVLETGLRWRIGSGSKVIIDEHPWLPKSEPVVPHSVREDIKGRRVSFLI
ncbi:hypothetical protein RHGRI_034285 [Rhododendron griersonianum]|uniref:Uncharacterized protein n=1 Tax=Rhododendron griersonianum TaxID=479676 RepID=A0AAV6I5L4_9ERIC|nr:hypothetical protein RHGRI_034285 [Rhododendron griersonianum]